jgi:hypothetical protein
MKQSIFNILIWCSGSNPDLLAKCPRSEHIKHAGYGTLVLIPSILALFGMTYALSTLTDHWYVYLPAGMVWALIIFFADRFLVSSFRKSNRLRSPDYSQRRIELINLKNDLFSFAFISRLILSVFIGVGIAHPFVLLYFHRDIEQILNSNKVLAEKSIRSEHDQKGSQLKEALASQEEYVKCLRKLLIYEQTDVKINTDCGSTSGIPGYKKRAATIQGQLNEAEYQLHQMYSRDSLNRSIEENLKQAELIKYQQAFSNGYLARENALTQLEEFPGSDAHSTKYFLIIFLILIDTLAITWKVFTTRGPYDDYLHVAEDDIMIETQIHLMENQKQLAEKMKSLQWNTIMQ